MGFYLLVVLFCAWPGAHSTLPLRIPSIIIPGREGFCPSNSTIKAYIDVVKEQIPQTIDPDITHSCQGTGWKRVAFLNMTQTDQNCPSSLKYISASVLRGCGRRKTGSFVCDSVIFPLHNNSYSKVCGRVQAYQRGHTDAFWSSLAGLRSNIDSSYVDGISLTYGPAGSRQHIWTFAAAYSENQFSDGTSSCACSNTQQSWPFVLPNFVGSNYFCDTGLSSGNPVNYIYYPDDPLWDGEGCGPHSTCCQLNNPPWFQTTLPQSTTEDIELRICNHGPDLHSDVILYFLDIYIK